MQSIDHLLLAKELIKYDPIFKIKKYRRAFIIGSVEPDFNPFSYLRGTLHYQSLRGHNNPNTTKYIEKEIKIYENKALKTVFDYFKLGVLIHYLADSFTYPHNIKFKGTIKDHLIYEDNLHYSFLKYLNNSNTYEYHKHNFLEFLRKYHQKYLNKKPSYKNDALHIIKSCECLMSVML